MTLFYLLSHEYRRLRQQSFEMVWVQCQNGLMIFLFAFLQQNTLSANPSLGLSYFWVCQGFGLFFLSDRLYKQDLQNGFYGNVLSSSTSLTLFLGCRGLIFVVIITFWSLLVSPLCLWILQIPFALFHRVILLSFLFNACIGVYSGALTLLMPNSKSYLMPFVVLPFVFPIFIFTIQGCEANSFVTALCFLIGHFLISLPILLFISYSNIKKIVVDTL